MTVSGNGLRGRLSQFDTTLRGPIKHGGADRVRYRHRIYENLTSRLLVAVAPVPCEVNEVSPKSLRLMGDIVRLEYLCLAEYHRRFGRLPQFNDKARSPKFSKAEVE